MARMRRGTVSIQMTARTRRGAPERPDIHEETIRFWWQPPGRLREEVSSNIDHQDRTVVRNGDVWWLYGSAMGAVTNESLDDEERVRHGTGGGEHFRPLLDPSWLTGMLEIDRIEANGRALHVEARPRDDLDGARHQWRGVESADVVRLEVDADSGIVRVLTLLIDGEELSSTRLDELVLGEAFSEDVFLRPSGIEFSPPGGRAGTVTLEEAAAEAPFPVFFVPDLPEGLWRLHATRIREPRFTLWLAYHRSDGRETFSVGQSDEAAFEPEGETIERGGTTYVVGERAVGFERDGTKVVLQSDSLDAQKLLELAAGLRRFDP
jgi:hypothetical protein